MVNKFGIYLRKLRLDEDEIMRDMAKKLGVSTSFLSAVENGKKNMPDGWYEKLINLYDLNRKEKENLRMAILYSTPMIEIDLDELKDTKRDLAILFKKRLDSLSDDEVVNITNILIKQNGEKYE